MSDELKEYLRKEITGELDIEIAAKPQEYKRTIGGARIWYRKGTSDELWQAFIAKNNVHVIDDTHAVKIRE